MAARAQNWFWTPVGLRRLRSGGRGNGKCLKCFGGPGEIRTHDLFHAMEARSQLRHRHGCANGGSATDRGRRKGPKLGITFQTLLGTAKKLGVNFYYYLSDRSLKSARSPHWLSSFGNGPRNSHLAPYGDLPKAPEILRIYQMSCAVLYPAVSQLAWTSIERNSLASG
jgi:hypothetical protein